jgi:cation diffusion facilitator family transporter
MADESFHCHCPEAATERTTSKQAKKRLLVACVMCFMFMTGELMGGYYSGSLAIMSDAAHMFSDFGSFCISLFVIWLSGKGRTKSMTFGFYRAEALGALATVVIIWYITGILTYLSIQRIKSGDFEIQDNAMIAVAAAAVVFNILLGLCLNGTCLPGLTGGEGVGFHGHSHGGHTRMIDEEGDVEVHSDLAQGILD